MADKPQTNQQKPTKPTPYSWVNKNVINMFEANKITDPQAQKNIIWTIQAETGGVPKRENMNYSSAERIVNVFKNNKLFAGMSFDDAVQKAKDMNLVKNPQALANAVYGGRMGNTDPNDGWKYRGGAGLGITGKANYQAVFKQLGMPIDTDPDVLTKNPDLAMRANLAFLAINGKGKNLADINQVNKIIRPAVSYEERLKNNPMPTDEILIKARNMPVEQSVPVQKQVSMNPMDNLPTLSVASDGTPAFDIRPTFI